MHLNVPGENDTKFQILVRKCKWMLVGVLAPEVVAFFAVAEWYAARVLVRRVCITPNVARYDRC